ncbi:MAG: hypothetical protein WD826_10155 [Actinomycetota bacterium]
MSRRKLRTVVSAVFVAALTLGAFGTAAPADALGAEVVRTDRFGRRTGRVVGFGDTTSGACCCAYYGEGAVGYGVKVCYLPIA